MTARILLRAAIVAIAAFGALALPALPANSSRATSAQGEPMQFISSRGTRDAHLPFSDAVRVGDVLYLSGALGNVPGKLELAPGGIEGETRQMFENIARVLEQNGLSFDNVFKCTVMLADMKEWAAFNKVYVSYFKPGRLPARSAFGASGLALGARVEMECAAYAGPEK